MNPLTNNYTSSCGQVNNLKESWANFINQWHWQWFVTLTFRDDVTRKTAQRKWNKWLRALEMELKDEVGYFRASELQNARQVLHFHALMLNVSTLRRLTWMDIWNDIAGFARIYKYDPTKNARWYLCKYITKDLSDYKLGGCVLRT